MPRKIKIAVGSLATAVLIVATGMGILSLDDDPDEPVRNIEFASQAEYEASRDGLLMKWENDEEMNIISEYSLLISILSYELGLEDGWAFDNTRPLKEQVLEKARLKRNEEGNPIRIEVISP